MDTIIKRYTFLRTCFTIIRDIVEPVENVYRFHESEVHQFNNKKECKLFIKSLIDQGYIKYE